VPKAQSVPECRGFGALSTTVGPELRLRRILLLMAFKISARTILQLGAELISSDAVAFYELVKNAFDAGSEEVNIEIVIAYEFEEYRELMDVLRGPDAVRLEPLRKKMRSSIQDGIPNQARLRSAIEQARSPQDLTSILEEANYIEIADTGSGMSLAELTENFLTIGTRSRLLQRRAWATQHGGAARPILGEKGVGRLSAMRLGTRLHVQTSRKRERHWNLLDIDWARFSHDSDDLLEDIDIEAALGPKKDDPAASGTTLRVSGLSSSWNAAKVSVLVRDQFSKFSDPFEPRTRYPIRVALNGDNFPVPYLSRTLFKIAHAILTFKYYIDPVSGPTISGEIDYVLRKRTKAFRIFGAHLSSVVRGAPRRTLTALGPFSGKLYWYNRRILSAVEGIGDLKQVRELVAQWAGGLMLYRDGFRVNPYGSPDDDWLDLDRTALAAPGYKVNRRQIVGKVDISAVDNPLLMDQTNREGLRDRDESRAFKDLLRHVLMNELRTFLDSVDKDKQAKEPVSFDDFEQSVQSEEEQLSETIDRLLTQFPEVKKDRELVASLRGAAGRIRTLMSEAKRLADSYERGRSEIIHLASLGLMVEIIAHELNRATIRTLNTLAEERSGSLSEPLDATLDSLAAQLKTLQKRLRILDPHSTAGRQVKEAFDLVRLIKDTLAYHEPQFQRHGIRASLRVLPKDLSSFRVTAVKGMIVQILENLLSNSVYWLKQQRLLDEHFLPKVDITFDAEERQLRVSDNGPGIAPESRDDVFQAFVTTKPPGEGKGLGLYISREVAQYNGATLYLDDTTVRKGRLNTFILQLEMK
jgi:signal transduction histidine kinase